MRSTIGKAFTGAAVVVFGVASLGWGQMATSAGSGTTSQLTRPPLGEGPATEAAWNAKRLRALNADRQKSMVSDAEKLLRVARELDAEVASNPRGALTPNQLRKVAEIEKLARSVKSKMTMSFASGPQLRGSTGADIGPEGP